jgi:predicted metalloprotease with PDZ domain
MIRYRIEVFDANAHLYRVTLKLAEPEAEQVLSLPVWIPGSYLVREFARHLSHFEAKQGSRPVRLVQRDKATWVAHCDGRGALTVSYLVYAFDTSVRTAWLDAQRGFFNGTSVFLRVHGREATPHQVQIGGLPRGWEIATALPAAQSGGRGLHEAADYDELVDHPVELGRFWRGEFKAAGITHEFVVAGAMPGFDGKRLLADARKICEAQIAFWHPDGAKPPFKRYLFLLNAVDDGYGGLEHRASTALIANRRDLPRVGMQGLPDGYVTLLGLISHEYFHTWNVKRLKPREFAPYDYTRENYTQLLWFFEGFTSYYDDIFLVRAGLIDEARYLKLVAKTVNQVLGTPGRQVQSVAQSSFDAWVKYYRPDENSSNATVSYYTKGSLVALALDLTLRGEGKGTLDVVLQALWQQSQGGPIDEADILGALQQVGKRSYRRELGAWVHGTGELPLAALLETHGVAWKQDAPSAVQRLGARMNEANGSLKVQSVLRGSAAEAAGLAPGDELIALGDWRLRKLDDLVLLRAFDQPLPLLAARDGRLLHLTLPTTTAAQGTVTLAPNTQAGHPVNKRRAAWLAPR